MAARSVWSPVVTGTTVAPNNFMRPTFGAWRSMSTAPMYTVHGRPTRAQAAARGDAVLPGARLRNDARHAEPLREHGLAQRVVDLVRAGVREVLALEPHLARPRPSRVLGACVSAVGRPTQLLSSAASSAWKSVRVQVLPDARFEFLERGDQRFRDVTAAERTEAAARVGILSRELVGQQFGGIETRCGCMC